jgi:hypothetical protein
MARAQITAVAAVFRGHSGGRGLPEIAVSHNRRRGALACRASRPSLTAASAGKVLTTRAIPTLTTTTSPWRSRPTVIRRPSGAMAVGATTTGSGTTRSMGKSQASLTRARSNRGRCAERGFKSPRACLGTAVIQLCYSAAPEHEFA